MILSNRVSKFTVPHTSTCIIRTVGTINDGDTIEVSSPVFPSFDLTTNALNSTTVFSVKTRLVNTIISDGNTEAILVCDDNDTVNMYVKEK